MVDRSESELREAQNLGEQDQRESVEHPYGCVQSLVGLTHYNPPSDPALRDKYDEGWVNAQNQGPNK